MFQNVFGSLQFSYILGVIGNSNAALLPVALLFVAIMAKLRFPCRSGFPMLWKVPTPVSAYLHSTTMVKAGVFVALVLLPTLRCNKIYLT